MRQVSIGRHSVEMATDQHPVGSSEICSGDDGVSKPVHLQVFTGGQGIRHQIGKGTLVVGLTGDVDQLGGEFDNTSVNAQRRQTGHVATVVR